MPDSSTAFQVVLGFLCGFVVFSVPGALFLRAIRLTPRLTHPATLLLAPAVGLCSYGPISLLCCSVLGYQRHQLAIVFVAFVALCLHIAYRSRPCEIEPLVTLPARRTCLLLAASCLCCLWPAAHLLPFEFDGGLYFAPHTYDHEKAAIVDAIIRHGLPPVTPFLSQGGEPAPLNYYYLYYFLSSQIKLLLPSLSGWECEVASTWLVATASTNLLVALAIRMSGSVLAGVLVFPIVFAAGPVFSLERILGDRWESLYRLAPGHGAETLLIQYTWVPQHVLAALAAAWFLYLVSQVLDSQRRRMGLAVASGLALATCFGASAWVCLALTLVFPAAVAVPLIQATRDRLGPVLRAAFVSFVVAFVFAVPVAYAEFRGASPVDQGFPVGLWLKPTVEFLPNPRSNVGSVAVHVLFYWLHFLPLSLGLSYVAGFLCLAIGHKAFFSPFRTISFVCVLGFLLVSQCLRSTIYNNDLGWRAILVPDMLLSVWGSVGIAKLWTSRDAGRWRRPALVACVVGLFLGVQSGLIWSELPNPASQELNSEKRDLHRLLARSESAWEVVRRHAGPDAVVQSNPDAWNGITGMAMNYSFALFADRRCVYADYVSVKSFSRLLSEREIRELETRVRAFFSRSQSIDDIRYFHEDLEVRVVLLSRMDGAWSSEAMERSGRYSEVYRDQSFKVYVAR